MRPGTEALAAHTAGFVAAEGYFGVDGSGRRFRLAVALGAVDANACYGLRDLFGVGTVSHHPRRRPHFDDEVCWQVQRLRDLVEVVVPFMDEHLPPSHKRRQYEVWRAHLLAYWDDGARRRRPCSHEGCDALSRAMGLCRHHYYLAHKR